MRRRRGGEERVPAGVEEADCDQRRPVAAEAGRAEAAGSSDDGVRRASRTCSGRGRPATASPASRPRASGRSTRRMRASRAAAQPTPAATCVRSGRSSSEAATLPPTAATKPIACRPLDMVAGDGDAPDHGNAGREGGDRRDDADRSRRHAAVEREQPDRAEHGRERRPRHLVAWDSRATHGDGDAERGEAERLRRGHHQQAGHDPCLHAAEEVADAPTEAGAERQ